MPPLLELAKAWQVVFVGDTKVVATTSAIVKKWVEIVMVEYRSKTIGERLAQEIEVGGVGGYVLRLKNRHVPPRESL